MQGWPLSRKDVRRARGSAGVHNVADLAFLHQACLRKSYVIEMDV